MRVFLNLLCRMKFIFFVYMRYFGREKKNEIYNIIIHNSR